MAFLFICVRTPYRIHPQYPSGLTKRRDVWRSGPLQHSRTSILPVDLFIYFFYISWLCLSRSSTPSSCLPFKVEEDCFSSIDPDSSLSDASFAAVSPLLGAGYRFFFFPLISLAGSDLCFFFFFFIPSLVDSFFFGVRFLSLSLLSFCPVDLFGIERYDLCMWSELCCV